MSSSEVGRPYTKQCETNGYNVGEKRCTTSRMARSLTSPEKELICWMLEHGHPEAKAFLPQLDQTSAKDWRCRCGCGSVNLSVVGAPDQTGGLNIIADFLSGNETDLSSILVYEKQGFLAGLEVYGLAGDAPKVLPPPNALRPFEA